jgi:hypothetical protein
VSGKVAKPGANAQVKSHEKNAPPNHDPWLVSSAKVEYSEEKALRPWKKPARRKIQPIGFSGRWDAITAPIAEKEIPQMTGTVAYAELTSPPLSSMRSRAETDKAREHPPTIQVSQTVAR